MAKILTVLFWLLISVGSIQAETVTVTDYKLYSLTYKYQGDYKIVYVIAESYEDAASVKMPGIVTAVRTIKVPVVLAKGGSI